MVILLPFVVNRAYSARKAYYIEAILTSKYCFAYWQTYFC